MKKKLFFISFLCISHLAIGQLVQQGADLDGEALNDQSGWSVSIDDDGDTIAIGAPLNDGNGNDSGHVRVYSFDGVSWIQQGVDLNGQFAEDQSGYAVSLSADGTTLAIGAPFNDNSGNSSGHVRVYSFDGVSWIQQGLDLNGENGGDRSGWTVSLNDDGTRIAIGAPSNNGGNGTNSGHVRVYEFDVDGAVWVQLGADIDGPAAGNLYGTAISLNGAGNRLAIGAPTNGDNGIQSGHIRIYEFDGVDWVQLGADINGDGEDSYLGRTVSLNGDGTWLAAGGAPDVLGDGGLVFGYARIYEYDGINWIQRGADINGDQLGDRFGTAVSLSNSGTVVAIGAPLNSNVTGFSGHFRRYGFDGINWIQQNQDVNGEADGDSFGYAVGLSGDGTTVVAGAPYNSQGGLVFFAGHARVFIDSALSADDPDFSAALRLYPNPSHSMATITLPHTSNVVTVKVNDIQGRLMYQSRYEATATIVLNTTALTKGLYFVTVTAENEKATLKMLVN